MVNNIEARLHGHRSVKGIHCIMSFAICNPIASKPPVYTRIVTVLVSLMMWTN